MSTLPVCWVLIPIKRRGTGKTRLSPVLTRTQRAELVDAMLRHVCAVAGEAPAISRTVLVGPSRHGIDPAIALIEDAGVGLNAALTGALALACAAADRPERIVIVAADLPCLTALDLELLAAVPSGSVAIAPDRHGVGTNALSLPLPEAAGFRFAYGSDSAARHRLEAERLGFSMETILTPGLGNDIDVPADLADAEQVFIPLR